MSFVEFTFEHRTDQHHILTIHAGANKGKGVGKMLEYLGVDPKNVLALGDGENDMEMLELVECGVAMENGKPGLKKIAQAVALTNDEEGVAEVLDILIDLKKQ